MKSENPFAMVTHKILIISLVSFRQNVAEAFYPSTPPQKENGIQSGIPVFVRPTQSSAVGTAPSNCLSIMVSVFKSYQLCSFYSWSIYKNARAIQYNYP